jgi:integrase/recombinase XerD
VKLPASKNTLAERILTEPDVVRILALEPDRRNQVLLRLLYIAGLRVSEIAALTWRDLQPRTDGGQVTVFGKGSKTRVVLLPSAIWRELLRFRHGAGLDAPVFPSRRSGGHLDQTAVLRIVTKAAARVGAGDTRPRLGGHHWPVPARTADRQLIAIPSGVVMAEVADLAMK